jgi:hypothetical protein
MKLALRRPMLLRAAGPLLGLFFLSGCNELGCLGGSGGVSFIMERVGVGSDAPRWGTAQIMKTADQISVISKHEIADAVLELFHDEVSLALQGSDEHVPTDHESCEHEERHFPLSMLAPGDYRLVHRRQNGEVANCGGACPWTRFDGDDALVLTMDVRLP